MDTVVNTRKQVGVRCRGFPGLRVRAGFTLFLALVCTLVAHCSWPSCVRWFHIVLGPRVYAGCTLFLALVCTLVSHCSWPSCVRWLHTVLCA